MASRESLCYSAVRHPRACTGSTGPPTVHQPIRTIRSRCGGGRLRVPYKRARRLRLARHIVSFTRWPLKATSEKETVDFSGAHLLDVGELSCQTWDRKRVV